MSLSPHRSLRQLSAVLICLLAITAAHATSPEVLRDAYIQWRGGEGFRAMHRRHSSGDIRVTALTGTFELWEDSAGRLRLDVHAGALEISRRVNGQGGFSLTPGGQVETLSPQDCEHRLLSMLTSYAGVLEGAQGATLSALPANAEGDKPPEGFRVSFPNGDLCDFQVRADGELVRCREVVDGGESISTFSDWRMLDGVRLPYTIESLNTADGQRTVMHVAQDSVNPPFDATLFAEPKAESRLSFRAGAHDSGTIAFELFAGNRLFLPGVIGGKEAVMLLDSGAEVTVIDTAFARAAGIESKGQMDIRGTGGTQNADLASGVTVSLGTMTVRLGTVVLMDLGQIARMIDHPVDVVLGKEVLNQTVADLDFTARTIDFREPATFTPPAEMTRVPLTVASGIRTVPIRVEGHETVNADFDLGNGVALILYPASVAKWKMLQDRPVAQRVGGGVGGLHPEHLMTVRTLEIGGHTLRDLPAVTPVSAEGLAFVASETVQGNVGMPVWSRFHLVMDFGRNQLFLSARPESLPRAFAKNRSGLTLLREGDVLKVLLVDPAFPKPVCETGAEIVAIDGLSVPTISVKTEWTERPAGTKVKLTFQDGHDATLTLQDYY